MYSVTTSQDTEHDGSAGPSGPATQFPASAQNNNKKSGRSENAMAKRVTMELTQKLNGHVGGGRVMGQGLSVEGQVKHLIQEARDPLKLCAIFAGWKPYA